MNDLIWSPAAGSGTLRHGTFLPFRGNQSNVCIRRNLTFASEDRPITVTHEESSSTQMSLITKGNRSPHGKRLPYHLSLSALARWMACQFTLFRSVGTSPEKSTHGFVLRW